MTDVVALKQDQRIGGCGSGQRGSSSVWRELQLGFGFGCLLEQRQDARPPRAEVDTSVDVPADLVTLTILVCAAVVEKTQSIGVDLGDKLQIRDARALPHVFEKRAGQQIFEPLGAGGRAQLMASDRRAASPGRLAAYP